jgi:hypothetical protein
MNPVLHSGHEHTEAAAASGVGTEWTIAAVIAVVGLAIASAYVLKQYREV